MPAPKNPFKAALGEGRLQLGCWLGLATPYVAEISAQAGFDWLVVDNEHAPNDLRSTVAQLQVIAASDSHAVVRPPIGEVWMVKQYLDAGAQTLLIPMIESADQAREMVAAVTYPPHGVRGVGAALGRASQFAAIPDYLTTARQEICLLLQVENRKGLAALDDILAVEGVDGVFIGPADLAADLGHLGDAGHPEVIEVIDDAIRRIVASGKAAGILMPDMVRARHYVDLGALFVATAVDVVSFASMMREQGRHAQQLRQPGDSTAGT